LRLKNSFHGYFLDPLRILNAFKKSDEVVEKTIIRPTYSYLGNYYIAEKVINSLIEYVTMKIKGITKIYKVLSTKVVNGVRIDIDIEIKYGENIPSISEKLKNSIVIEIDKATGINLTNININVKGISR
jgi:uncharacterized alkaline shock family protein YloU